MNDTSPQLEIPTASVHALIDLNDDWDDDSELRRSIRDIAAPVVVAELRRLADELDVVREEMRATDERTIRSSGLGEGIRRIRARAAQLDPQDGAA